MKVGEIAMLLASTLQNFRKSRRDTPYCSRSIAPKLVDIATSLENLYAVHVYISLVDMPINYISKLL
jgi:hypothetical protein